MPDGQWSILPICADSVQGAEQAGSHVESAGLWGGTALGRLFKQTGDTLLGFGHPESKNSSSSSASRLAEDFMHKFSSSL